MKEQTISNHTRMDVRFGKWMAAAAHVPFTWLSRLKDWLRAWWQKLWIRNRKKQTVGPDRRMERKKRDGEETCGLDLIQEIEKAREEWAAAQQKLNEVVEHDQIDYAIYCMEAAEKRYEMLLRQAKKSGISFLDQQSKRNHPKRRKRRDNG